MMGAMLILRIVLSYFLKKYVSQSNFHKKTKIYYIYYNTTEKYL